MTRKRSPNFIESEKLLFSQLLEVHAPAIECKRSDAQTAKEKKEAWEALHASFNASTTYVTRTIDNLKSLWDNMKAQARKALGTERREMYGTGGGAINTEGLPTNVDEAVIAVIGKSATGLENPHDHDGVVSLAFAALINFQSPPLH
ncbi:myb/SANT-like DNA-binding domain-containing protein 3 [Thrips palmi]|uniref:Regulatory protein zeste n=1 Tax=Thrips palmi TaxID=161013 RepID=A0A6P9ACX5_THRPL|nr:myb/SANT-like DNA-binding domain-containing protein 3 [Thrips palmi]